jgi:hypothetical protein
MPVEPIGEFGTPGAELEWLQAQGTIVIRHLQRICGDPPPEMELEIVWQEHDLGAYPTIASTWEDGMRGAPWPYISRCQSALAAYEDEEEPPHWSAPCDFDGDSEEDADWENPEPLVEPPPDASLLELHRYVSKLAEYAVRASSQASRKPRLVEKEEDDIPGPL